MASFEHYINRIEKLFIENAFRINYESYDYSHNLKEDSYGAFAELYLLLC